MDIQEVSAMLTKKKWFRMLSLALLCAGVVVIALVVKGWGFALTPDNLFEPARWSNIPGSLVENGMRGLGGGLEYALADDFCDVLIPRFTLDDPKPTCEQLREVLKKAFDRWTAGHPILRFTDVTGQIQDTVLRIPPPGRNL
jgi:hypothetical protein